MTIVEYFDKSPIENIASSLLCTPLDAHTLSRVIFVGNDGRKMDKSIELYREITERRNLSIDVILMKGMVPVFLSCKNGYVDADELYKLSAVADRFGRGYVKKVLIVSDLDKMGAAGDCLIPRSFSPTISNHTFTTPLFMTTAGFTGNRRLSRGILQKTKNIFKNLLTSSPFRSII